ncbi:MAG: hypothetical protein V1696_02505 [Candidatus Jorgensenbacteria bacterium]
MNIGLVQINNSFSGQHYFPYSVGILQSYVAKNLVDSGRYTFSSPIFRREKVSDAVDKLSGSDVAAFSVYCWSERLSLAIAEELKRKSPSTLIVFGGPQVPRHDRPWEVEAFLKKNRFIDIAVHGAGEIPFAAILERGLYSWGDLPSVSFLNPSGSLEQNQQAPALVNLELVPEPYLTGVFDELMIAHKDVKWIGIDETDRNCPFECTFCGWGLLASKPILRSLEESFRVIDWFAEHEIVYVFYCNANFGILKRDLEIAEYLAETKKRTGYPRAVSVQDGKNVEARVHQIRKRLIAGGIDTPAVISIQSLYPPTLEAIKRKNISTDSYMNLQRSFTEDGIKTMSDLIVPLPKETYISFADGISTLIGLGQHNRIQINNLSVVPDAELSHKDYRARYELETIWTRTVNIHGQIENEEVPEMQELVVATNAMPSEDWVRARAFAWWAGFLHFDKLLQIPFVLMREVSGGSVTYRELIEVFSSGKLDENSYPVLSRIRRFFEDKAHDIRNGGVEYCHSSEWLNVYWPADEYAYINLVVNGELDTFYEEAERALSENVNVSAEVISDAIRLNQTLLKLPFQDGKINVRCSSNIWEFYRSVLMGKQVPLQFGDRVYQIDRETERWTSWDVWFREVVWFCNRSGAYLRGTSALGHQVAGHY